MVKVVARPPETRAGTAKRRRSPPLEFQTDVTCVSVSPRPWGCDETRHLRRLAPRGFHDPGPAINRRFRKLRPKRRVRCSGDPDLTARVSAATTRPRNGTRLRCRDDFAYGHLLRDSEDYLRGLLDAYDDVTD
jgi:hypothetical protein